MFRNQMWVTVIVPAVAILAAAGCGSQSVSSSPSGTSSGSHTLVMDSAFVLQNDDPAVDQTPTGAFLNHQVYQTLLTFNGSNVATPVPDLASKYSVNKTATQYIFALRPNAEFSDGAPVTATDVVFSLNRVANLAGPNSGLFTGLTFSAPNKTTVLVTSASPNLGVPALLASPPASILSAGVVRANGGDDSKQAGSKDKAGTYLNSHSAGSGPYELQAINPSSQIVLVPNPHYGGPAPKPFFTRVVVKNVQAQQQRLDITSGNAQLATDLSGSLLNGLPSSVVVRGPASGDRNYFLAMNVDPKKSPVTASANVREAVRYALDYNGIRAIVGPSALPLAGIIPTGAPGALPASEAPTQDLAKAKSLVAASGLSHTPVSLTTIGGLTFQGISFDALSAKIQSDLSQAGLNVRIKPESSPGFIQSLNSGQYQLLLFPQRGIFPDPSTWLTFAPGGVFAAEAGYTKATAPANVLAAAQAAATATDPTTRLADYHAWQRTVNATPSPFAYLFATKTLIAASASVTNVQVSPVGWWVTLADVR